jgi:predicted transcriptional regulator of viral defense system
MYMKKNSVSKSLLTQAQAEIIDETSLRHGDIITFEQIFDIFGREYSRAYLKRIMSQLVKNGWLVRLRKGEYFVTDLSNLGSTSLSVYFIANYYVQDSYVSFGQALQYHGMYDQLLSTVTSVSLKQHKQVALDGINYRYVKTQDKYYFGYEEVRVDGRIVRVATAEKALIDMLQFHRTTGVEGIVTEKVLTHHHDLNFDLLRDYLARSPRVVKKLMDSILAKLDTSNSSFSQGNEVNTWIPNIKSQRQKVEIAWSGDSNEGGLKA